MSDEGDPRPFAARAARRRFPAAWKVADAAWAVAAARRVAFVRPAVHAVVLARAVPRAWGPGPFVAGWAAAMTATCVALLAWSLVAPSPAADVRSADEEPAPVPAATARAPAAVARPAFTPRPGVPGVVLANTVGAPRAAAVPTAEESVLGDTRVPDAAPVRPRSGLAGIFDAPPAVPADAAAVPPAPSAEEEAADWARRVATVVGDDLTAVETGCIGAAARAGLADDPSLWGPAIAGDLEALRPFGDRVARGCGVAPARLGPVLERALAEWGGQPRPPR